MEINQCPLCLGQLQIRVVTPCWDCGGDPKETDHYKDHEYAHYTVFSTEVILCDFCGEDLPSYDPEFFGFESDEMDIRQHMKYIGSINHVELTNDQYCPTCQKRLTFLEFVANTRAKNRKSAG